MSSSGNVVPSSSTTYTDRDIGAIYLFLRRNNRVVRKIDYDGHPLKLDLKSNADFNKITVQPVSCVALERSGIPIDPQKVKMFAKYSRLDFYFCDFPDSKPNKKRRDSSWIVLYDDEYEDEYEYDLGTDLQEMDEEYIDHVLVKFRHPKYENHSDMEESLDEEEESEEEEEEDK